MGERERGDPDQLAGGVGQSSEPPEDRTDHLPARRRRVRAPSGSETDSGRLRRPGVAGRRAPDDLSPGRPEPGRHPPHRGRPAVQRGHRPGRRRGVHPDPDARDGAAAGVGCEGRVRPGGSTRIRARGPGRRVGSRGLCDQGLPGEGSILDRRRPRRKCARDRVDRSVLRRGLRDDRRNGPACAGGRTGDLPDRPRERPRKRRGTGGEADRARQGAAGGLHVATRGGADQDLHGGGAQRPVGGGEPRRPRDRGGDPQGDRRPAGSRSCDQRSPRGAAAAGGGRRGRRPHRSGDRPRGRRTRRHRDRVGGEGTDPSAERGRWSGRSDLARPRASDPRHRGRRRQLDPHQFHAREHAGPGGGRTPLRSASDHRGPHRPDLPAREHGRGSVRGDRRGSLRAGPRPRGAAGFRHPGDAGRGDRGIAHGACGPDRR